MEFFRRWAVPVLLRLCLLAPAIVGGAELVPGIVNRDGLRIEYSLSRTGDGERQSAIAGENALLRLRISDETSGRPIRGLRPGAWLDAQVEDPSRQGVASSCREKIGAYLKGSVGMRPLVDFTSYYLMVMNQDSSISVIDPVVSMTGRTSLVASILLRGPGIDWGKSRDGGKLFVAVPRTRELAVVDTRVFRLAGNVALPSAPTRVVMQPDDRFVWVGYPGDAAVKGGIVAIDVDTQTIVAKVETGDGHHEFAFSSEGALLAVSNRQSGTVSFIDVASRRVLGTVSAGAEVIGIGYSPLSRRFYASLADGNVMVLEGPRDSGVARIRLAAGAGPLRATADGRWIFALNATAGRVHIIDTARDRLAFDVPMEGKPFQMVFTDNYVHIRRLDSNTVGMINLGELGKTPIPIVNQYEAGTIAPGLSRDLPVAAGIARAADDSAVFVASPGDASVFYYMEGMNSTAGSFQGYGHSPRAVEVVNRAIRETEPGVYTAVTRVPVSGNFNIAFMLDSPRVVHCFDTAVEANPLLPEHAPPRVEFFDTPGTAAARSTHTVRFRLLRENTALPGLSPAVRFYRSPGSDRGTALARETRPGEYEASVSIGEPGAWVVHVQTLPRGGVPAMQKYITVLAR